MSQSSTLIELGFNKIWYDYKHDKGSLGAILDILQGLNGWIAGGIVRKLVQNEPLGESDIDLWFPTNQDYDECVIRLWNYYKHGKQTNLANTFKMADFKIQVISFSRWQKLETILNSFDFTVCQFGYSLTDNVFFTYQQSLDDLKNHQLRLNPQRKEPTTPRRFIKYAYYKFAPATHLEYQGLIDSITFEKFQGKALTLTPFFDIGGNYRVQQPQDSFYECSSYKNKVLTLIPKGLRGY